VSRTRLLVIASSLVVVAAVAGGLFLAGSPATRRARRLDDLLSAAIDQYRREHGSLPADLDALDRSPRTTAKLTDPETGVRYEYRMLEPASDHPSYQLCASFGAETGEGKGGRHGSDGRSDFWRHHGGRQCFTIEADQSE
jgi:type II secretory pathway pseudopilin PulG